MTADQNELGRMILAARQIGEVVGEDLLDNIGLDNQGRAWMNLEDVSNNNWNWCPVFLENADALDILTARVWRAVQGWADVFNYAWSWFYIRKGSREFEFRHLPSAVAAIHKHWKESCNGCR